MIKLISVLDVIFNFNFYKKNQKEIVASKDEQSSQITWHLDLLFLIINIIMHFLRIYSNFMLVGGWHTLFSTHANVCTQV